MRLDPLPTLTAYVVSDHDAYVAAHGRALRAAERAEAQGQARVAQNQRRVAAALAAECVRVTGRPVEEA